MEDGKTTIGQLKNELARFVRERDWEKYHSPKNLSMSIAIEASELMEKFQWLSNEESYASSQTEADLQEIGDELADIAIYVLDLCNVLNLDLSSAIERKLRQNEEKYPREVVRGKAHKYTFYERQKE